MSDIKNKVIEEIKKIYDPEIPVNIYELGLIYKIEVVDNNKINVDMTLTSPNCPVAESLPKQVKDNIMKVEGVSDVNLNLVWEPPWDKEKMSEAAKNIVDKFLQMIKTGTEMKIDDLTEDQKLKIMSLSGVKKYPMRVKCATLSWHTLVSALEGKKQEVNTEETD